MHLKNVKVSRQLGIGLGIIILFVVLLGTVALTNSFRLWKNTQELHDHPYLVQRTLGEIRADILTIQLEMKDLMLEKDVQTIPLRVSLINTHESNILRNMDVLYSAYLGPETDIDNTYNAIVAWKPIRDETIRLLQTGEFDEATKRVTFDGTGGLQAQKAHEALDVISNFAAGKAAEFYQTALLQKNNNIVQLGFVLGIILLLSAAISFGLRALILTPLKELTAASGALQHGKLETRSLYASANEFGVLSRAFNMMAETVQEEMQNKDKVAMISEAMMLQDDLHGFCQGMLKAILTHTGSQIGAVYLLNGQKTCYELFESIGLQAGAVKAFSAASREGEFGLALAAKQIQHLSDIPPDTQFAYPTVNGSFMPKEIWTIPVLHGDEVIAVVSLAGIRKYPAASIRLVKDIWGILSARLNGALSFRQTKEFSGKLQSTNTELEAQTKELVLQADELVEQNIELEMQKKMLDESDKLKSTFLSNMSHELRTPLNSVIALASVLNRRLRGIIPEDEHSYLEVIERNGKHLLSLVNDILDISRIEAGREELSITQFSMRKLVDDVVEMINPQAQEKCIQLENRIPENFPAIGSDVAMCRHILQNLIGNAVKFTDAGGVEIAAAISHGQVQISVTDTGIGIPPSQIHLIFDEFRQADDSTSKKYGGTGLGLAIAKKYARLLHGNITVTSSPGDGSTFVLQLPLILGESEVTGKMLHLAERGAGYSHSDTVHEMPSSLCPASGSGKSLLLVEDSEPAIIQIRDILSDQGYQVHIARNGKEALAGIETALPDAMILDLMMPEVDGFQVLKAIRGVEKTAQIPVLILTAKHVTKEELSFLEGNHIFQLIQKGSIGKTALLAAVRGMILERDVQQADSPQKPPHVSRRQARKPVDGKPLVLVVEDNPDNVMTVRALLEESCKIIAATDGQDGLAKAKEQCPALILLDISLPIMDGFQMLKNLRQDESLRDIPVIALTARAMSGDREVILAHGFDGYVSKPIDDALLKQTMRGFLHEE